MNQVLFASGTARRYPSALLSIVLVLLAALSLSCSRDTTIVVGAKAFDEGYILGHIAVEALAIAGYEVEEQFGVASSAMRSALETGQVDLYYEYTGTAYTVYAGADDRDVMTDPTRVYQAIRNYDSLEHNLIWLHPMPFNNTYALLMRHENAETHGISSLTDLKKALLSGATFRIAVDAEFYERPDGWQAMVARYEFPAVDVIKMEAGLIYTALSKGEVDVGMGYSTDGRIEALGLAVLEDDRSFFPAYNPAAVVRKELLQKNPHIRSVLEQLNGHITTDVIRRLNREVSMNHRDPRKVAREWLRSIGFSPDTGYNAGASVQESDTPDQ